MEIAVTSTLLISPYQNRWSGRETTWWMESRVGGIGGLAGCGVMSAPGLKALVSTR